MSDIGSGTGSGVGNSAGPIIQLADGWDQIKKAIDLLVKFLEGEVQITQKGTLFPNANYVQVYTTCYNMCTQRAPFNWSEQLYQRHSQTITEYLAESVRPTLQHARSNELLEGVVKRWGNHKIMNKWMKMFFTYLDRYYVKYHNLATLETAALVIFKDQVFDHIKATVTSAMLTSINAEREGEAIDRGMLRSCIDLYESMGMGNLAVYTADFEAHLLMQTKEFYARKADEWLQDDSTPVFLIKIEAVLGHEKARVQAYLNPDTDARLMRVIEEETLEKRETELLEKEGSGCRVLLMNDSFPDLSRMYRLFGRVPEGLVPMADIVRQHILGLGNEKVEQRRAKLESASGGGGGSDDKESGECQFVREMLMIHDKYLAVVNREFDGHALFQKALKDAFSEFVNADVTKIKSSECISTFCDRLLKTGGDKISEQETEEFLEKAVQLFSYLQDKDLFAEIYRNQLAKRLLNQRSESDDMERTMIGKLKMKCGAQFTSKMEGMLNDLAVGVDHQNEFNVFCRDAVTGAGSGSAALVAVARDADAGALTCLPTEFAVQVLTQGYWPTYRMIECRLPPVMDSCLQTFARFYENTQSGRKLQWVHSLGSVELKASYSKKFYHMQLSSLQAIVLMEFNGESEPRTFESLSNDLNIAEDVMKRVLHSLSCAKFKILTRISNDAPQSLKGANTEEAVDGGAVAVSSDKKKDSGIKATDSFIVNEGFQYTMRKFRVPMASLEESHNPKRVEEDRSYVIEACIVRIMKARKTLPHQQLVGEVFSQLSLFKPDGKVIKKRIEALIEREYLDRQKDQPNVYVYLA